jgi:hypothetical protein
MNTPSLWRLGALSGQLNASIESVASDLESEDNAIREQAILDLESLLMQEHENRELLESKSDATCWIINQLKGRAAYRKEQSKRLSALADADMQRADQLQQTMIQVLTRLFPTRTRHELPNHQLISRKSQAVEIIDQEKLPKDMFKVKTTATPDKTAIKAVIKSGKEVAGAMVVDRRNWIIK